MQKRFIPWNIPCAEAWYLSSYLQHPGSELLSNLRLEGFKQARYVTAPDLRFRWSGTGAQNGKGALRHIMTCAKYPATPSSPRNSQSTTTASPSAPTTSPSLPWAWTATLAWSCYPETSTNAIPPSKPYFYVHLAQPGQRRGDLEAAGAVNIQVSMRSQKLSIMLSSPLLHHI